MLNQFYLHFREPKPLELVHSALIPLDPDADIAPVFEGSFACILDASPSAFRHAVDQAFLGEAYMYCQVKNKSFFVIPGQTLQKADP